MELTDPQLLASMARLHNNRDFERFMTEYVGGLLANETQACIDAEQPARHQGAAQILQRIQSDLEEAEEAFFKVTRQQEIPIS